MSIPFDSIRKNIKEKRITRINQLFEYATIPEWKDAIELRKGTLERLIEDPRRWAWRHVIKASWATGIKESTLNRLIDEQKKHNWAMKRAEGQSQESPAPPTEQ